MSVACGNACAAQELPATSPTALPEPSPVLTPPQPPQIACTGNQLTIVAENATLSAILEKLRPCVGVEMHSPEGDMDDRIFVHLGPGPKRDILDRFLSSTELNYIIESSAGSQDHIVSVSLTARSEGKDGEGSGKPAKPSGDLAQTPARRAWLAGLEAVKHGVALPDSEAGQPASDPPDTSTAVPESRPAAGAAERGTPAAEATSVGPGEVTSAVPAAAPGPVIPAALAPVSVAAPVLHPDVGNTSASADDAGSSVTGSASLGAPAAPGSTGATAPAAPATPVQDGTLAEAGENATPVLQKQINQMQDLFEQRRKMIAAQANPPAPN